MASSIDAVTADAGGVYWRYNVPNTIGTVLLLTIGRTAMKGQWSGELGQYYVAWAPLPKRDKVLEDRLIEAGVIHR